ncbi:TPA: hypothetical protein P0E36_004928 [Vibrio harveyi]|nr:hypothetical protein [Vibrio harveyi]
MSYGLIDMGHKQKNMALSSGSSLVNQENQRNSTNEQLEAQHKSNIATGAGTGASLGLMVGGPVGMGIGAVVGGLAASLF